MQSQSILVIGNSPNQLGGGNYSWQQLMARLRTEAGMSVSAKEHETKPFSLHFEEIRNRYLSSAPSRTESEFIALVSKTLRELRPNEVHQALMALNVSDVLTTNFDDCLEQVYGERRLEDFTTGETKHSLFRRWATKDKYIWHIHGDLAKSRTMMLGHDRYVESCSRIRRYLDKEIGVSFKPFSMPLTARFKTGTPWDATDVHSWVDLFMTRNVHIVGLGFDYTESDLWYLLSFRARLRRSDSGKWNHLRSSNVTAHLFDTGDETTRQKQELLRSFEVEVRTYAVRGDQYGPAWRLVLAQLEDSLGMTT